MIPLSLRKMLLARPRRIRHGISGAILQTVALPGFHVDIGGQRGAISHCG
jgi:hypothetical protein